MTIWIISESDKKGRAVRQIWLQGGIHNETPTEKNFPSWGTFGPPPPFKKEGVRGQPGSPNIADKRQDIINSIIYSM